MTRTSQLTVVFEDQDGELKPRLEGASYEVREVHVENIQDFGVSEGSHFAVHLIRVDGTRRVKDRAVVRIFRELLSTSDEQILEDFWIDPAVLNEILLDIRLGHHLRFVGPKGTGKTTLVPLIAEILGVPHFKLDGAGIFKPKDLVGAERGVGGGQLEFQPSELYDFTVRVQDTEGVECLDGFCLKGIVCADEFTRMRMSVGAFHSLLDHTRQLGFTTCEGTRILRTDGIVFILTDNPAGGGYVGNARLGVALGDRAELYEFDYPPAEFEIPWLVKNALVDEVEATRIVSAANKLRDVARSPMGLENGGPSPRRTLAAAKFVANGVGLDRAIWRKIVMFYGGDHQDPNSTRGQVVASLRSEKLLDTSSSLRSSKMSLLETDG